MMLENHVGLLTDFNVYTGGLLSSIIDLFGEKAKNIACGWLGVVSILLFYQKIKNVQ